MGKHITPTDVVERLIGKPDKIGEVTGVDGKAPYQWRTARGLRAAGDIPYASHMRALLSHSAAHRLGLTAEHLIWGADEAEIEAILAERGSQPQSHSSPATAGEGDASPRFASRREKAA
ncbi:MAG: hypothetical protein ACK47C_07835 [Paracoccaceae bacterium]